MSSLTPELLTRPKDWGSHHLKKGSTGKGVGQTHIQLTSSPMKAAPKVFRMSVTAEAAMSESIKPSEIESPSEYIRTRLQSGGLLRPNGPKVGW
jgi:hypothetical protein